MNAARAVLGQTGSEKEEHQRERKATAKTTEKGETTMKKVMSLLMGLFLAAVLATPGFCLLDEKLVGMGAIVKDYFGLNVDLGGASFLDFGQLTPGQGETGAVGFGSDYHTNRNKEWKVKLIVEGIKHYTEDFYLPLANLKYKLIKTDSSNGTPTDGWNTWAAAPYTDWKDVYTAAAAEHLTDYVAFGIQFKFTGIPVTQRQGGYYGNVHVAMYDAD
jgi:hypothetical protein